MSVNSSFLRLVTSAEIASDLPAAPGTLRIGRDLPGVISAPVACYAFRLFIPDATVTASLDTETGGVSVSVAGTAQIESLTVTAAAGATANGNLALTLTSSLVTGTPLAIAVPLRTHLHTTAAKIATAIAAQLNATAAVSAHFKAYTVGAVVLLKSIYALANVADWNLAITAGLGVSAVAGSTTVANGVKGILIERLGGDAKDALGQNFSAAPAGIAGIAVVNDSRSVESVTVQDAALAAIFPGIAVGGWAACHLPQTLAAGDGIDFSAAGKAIVDVYFHGN